jgi:hypothetical protein
MIPPGEVASPFSSTAPAVPAPCVLASFGEGLELPVVVPVAPFFIAAPPVVVLLFILSSAVAFEAGPPACELPPAALPCASAAVLASAKAAASEMDFIFMVVSRLLTPHQLIAAACMLRKAGATNARKRAAPSPHNKDMLRIVTGRCGGGSVVCASLSQGRIPRVATARKTNGADASAKS